MVTSAGPMPAQAQEFVLPKPGVRVNLSPQFNPPVLKGLKVHPDDPFRFDFILDEGDSLPPVGRAREGEQEQLKQNANRLIKYFLASLTVPETDLWVNLSPYEKDRIVPESFGQTEMGRDLLAQDYLLKQITASLIYPEGETGKKFWNKVYAQAQAKYGTTQVPINTFNKVWIIPEKAVVYENAQAGTAYVVESKLKVMLEEDYLALEKNSPPLVGGVRGGGDTSALGSQVVRDIIIPELTKEINEGKNFAQLRQVYQSLILATWYKKKIKDSILTQIYADKNKVAGVGYSLPPVGRAREGGVSPQDIYQQYLTAFKKGVFNYIKEEPSPTLTPRKYFSGGFNLSLAMLAFVKDIPDSAMNAKGLVEVSVNFRLPKDPSLITRRSFLRKTAVGGLVALEMLNLSAQDKEGVAKLSPVEQLKKARGVLAAELQRIKVLQKLPVGFYEQEYWKQLFSVQKLDGIYPFIEDDLANILPSAKSKNESNPRALANQMLELLDDQNTGAKLLSLFVYSWPPFIKALDSKTKDLSIRKEVLLAKSQWVNPQLMIVIKDTIALFERDKDAEKRVDEIASQWGKVNADFLIPAGIYAEVLFTSGMLSWQNYTITAVGKGTIANQPFRVSYGKEVVSSPVPSLIRPIAQSIAGNNDIFINQNALAEYVEHVIKRRNDPTTLISRVFGGVSDEDIRQFFHKDILRHELAHKWFAINKINLTGGDKDLLSGPEFDQVRYTAVMEIFSYDMQIATSTYPAEVVIAVYAQMLDQLTKKDAEYYSSRFILESFRKAYGNSQFKERVWQMTPEKLREFAMFLISQKDLKIKAEEILNANFNKPDVKGFLNEIQASGLDKASIAQDKNPAMTADMMAVKTGDSVRFNQKQPIDAAMNADQSRDEIEKMILENLQEVLGLEWVRANQEGVYALLEASGQENVGAVLEQLREACRHLGKEKFNQYWPGLLKIGLKLKSSFKDFLPYHHKQVYRFKNYQGSNLDFFVWQDILGDDFDEFWPLIVNMAEHIDEQHAWSLFIADAFHLSESIRFIPHWKDDLKVILLAAPALGKHYAQIMPKISWQNNFDSRYRYYQEYIDIAVAFKGYLAPDELWKLLAHVRKTHYDLVELAYSPYGDFQGVFKSILDSWVKHAQGKSPEEFLQYIDAEAQSIKRSYFEKLLYAKDRGILNHMYDKDFSSLYHGILLSPKRETYHKLVAGMVKRWTDTHPAFVSSLGNSSIDIDARMQMVAIYKEFFDMQILVDKYVSHSYGVYVESAQQSLRDTLTALRNACSILPINDQTPDRMEAHMPALRKAVLEMVFGKLFSDDENFFGDKQGFREALAMIEHDISAVNTAFLRYIGSSGDVYKLMEYLKEDIAKQVDGRTPTQFRIYVEARAQNVIVLLGHVSHDHAVNYFHILSEVILSGSALYVQRLRNLYDALRGTADLRYETFIENTNVDLRIRMEVVGIYTEFVLLQKIFMSSLGHGSRDEVRKKIESTQMGFDQLLFREIKTPPRKIPEQMNELMVELRLKILEFILGRPMPEHIRPLLNDGEFVDRVGAIVSILAQETGEEKERLTWLSKFAINTFIDQFDPKNKDALAQAEMALTETLMNIDVKFFKDDSFDLPMANQEARTALVKAGYDNDLWRKGIEIPWDVMKAADGEENQKKRHQTAYALVELILSLGITEIDGQEISLEKTPQQIASAKEAEVFLEKIEKGKQAEALLKKKNAIDALINDLHRIDDEILKKNGQQKANIVVKKDFFKEASTGCGGGQACFAVGGVHQERPLVTALVANLMFIQIFNQGGKQMATADVILGEEGAYVDAGYNGSAYDVETAFAAAIAQMTLYMPKVVLKQGSAGYNFFAKYITPLGKSEVITKPKVIFNEQYFDTSAQDARDKQIFTIASPLVITRAVLEEKGIFNILKQEVKKKRAVVDSEITRSIFQYLNDSQYPQRAKYKPFIGVINQMLLQDGVLQVDDNAYKTFINAVNARLSPEVFDFVEAEQIFDGILDVLQKRAWPMELLTPVGDAAMKTGDSARLNNTGGIDLTSDKALEVKMDSRLRGNDVEGIKFNVDPAMLEQLKNAPGFVPVIINIQPMNNLKLFLGIQEKEGEKQASVV